MTLLFTGGHLTPALSLLAYCKEFHPETKVVFAGRQFTRVETAQKSREQEEVERLGAQFIAFSTGKLTQGNVLKKIPEAIHFIQSIGSAFLLLNSAKPDAVLSFGSYLAVPIVFAAWIMRIPVVTHEQTRSAGFANSVIAHFATSVAISHPDSMQFFPARKTVLTGNVLRKSLFNQKTTRPSWIMDSTKPLLYVTGGSQGSEIINTTVAQCLPQLLKNWVVIHQCGNPTKSRNYKQELTSIKNSQAAIHRKRYYIREWVTESELSWIFQHADAIVSRAGANTTEEIVRARVPAILIPLPFSHRDEQLLNAKAISKLGGALLLPQQHLTPAQLISELETLQRKRAAMQKALEKITFPENPEAAVFKLLLQATQ